MEKMLRKLTLFVLLIGFVAVTAGCDSNDDDDASVVVGAWGLGGLSDASGDRTEGFSEGFNSVVITFNGDNTMSLAIDSKNDALDQNISGTYTTNESAESLSASLTVGGSSLPLTFTYEEVNSNSLRLTATGNTSVLLGSVFQTSLADPVVITVVRVN
ncbi:MAG: lipocalin family protein [Rhodothermales bacterium]